MKSLAGKKALILGIANERSLAYGIASSLKEAGAQLALTYMNDSIKKRVLPLAEKLAADFTFEVDITSDLHLQNLASKIKEEWGHFDILVHSIAYAPAEALKGKLSAVTREDFATTMDISAYSFLALIGTLRDLLSPGASIITLTYHGAQKVIPNYHIMGVAKAALESSVRYLAYELGSKEIRVNGISAGPVRTLAASGVKKFRSILDHVEEDSPLQLNISIEDVGEMAAFLSSSQSRAITGQIFYVDSGLSILSA